MEISMHGLFLMVNGGKYTTHTHEVRLLDISPENWWLEDDPFFLERPVFRGYVLVSGRVYTDAIIWG